MILPMCPDLKRDKMFSERKDAYRGNMKEKTTKPTLALIVTGLGSLQNGLVAIMTTMPQIQVILVAEEASRALRMIADHRPALVLLDVVLPGDEEGTVLKEFRTRWPSTRCIVLTDDVQQQQGAEAAGADAVLIKGFPAANLIAAIEGLLSQEDEGGFPFRHDTQPESGSDLHQPGRASFHR